MLLEAGWRSLLQPPAKRLWAMAALGRAECEGWPSRCPYMTVAGCRGCCAAAAPAAAQGCRRQATWVQAMATRPLPRQAAGRGCCAGPAQGWTVDVPRWTACPQQLAGAAGGQRPPRTGACAACCAAGGGWGWAALQPRQAAASVRLLQLLPSLLLRCWARCGCAPRLGPAAACWPHPGAPPRPAPWHQTGSCAGGGQLLQVAMLLRVAMLLGRLVGWLPAVPPCAPPAWARAAGSRAAACLAGSKRDGSVW